MKTVIAVYNSHIDAVKAITELKNKKLSTKKVSIIGKADKAKDAIILDDKNVMKIAGAEAGLGAVLGSALGILAGVGIFVVPGLGFLYGAGALIGGIAGFDFGLMGGGIISALTVAGIKITETQKYDNYIKEGKFLVIVQGSEEETGTAHKILDTTNGVVDVEAH